MGIDSWCVTVAESMDTDKILRAPPKIGLELFTQLNIPIIEITAFLRSFLSWEGWPGNYNSVEASVGIISKWRKWGIFVGGVYNFTDYISKADNSYSTFYGPWWRVDCMRKFSENDFLKFGGEIAYPDMKSNLKKTFNVPRSQLDIGFRHFWGNNTFWEIEVAKIFPFDVTVSDNEYNILTFYTGVGWYMF